MIQLSAGVMNTVS